MVLIGIDPHKATHTAVVIDESECELARIKVSAGRSQVAALLEFADSYRPRRWAIQSPAGWGSCSPSSWSTPVRTSSTSPPPWPLGCACSAPVEGPRTTRTSALSTAIAALRDPHLRTVVVEDHAMVLRLLADRHQDLTSLNPSGVPPACVDRGADSRWVQRRLSAAAAVSRLRAIHPANSVEEQRKEMALDLVADIRRLDKAIAQVNKRTASAVAASGTTVTRSTASDRSWPRC